MCGEQIGEDGENSFPDPDGRFNVGTGLFSSTLLRLLLLRLWYGVYHVHGTSRLLSRTALILLFTFYTPNPPAVCLSKGALNFAQSANAVSLGPQSRDQSEEPRHFGTCRGIETVWSDHTIGFPYLPSRVHARGYGNMKHTHSYFVAAISIYTGRGFITFHYLYYLSLPFK